MCLFHLIFYLHYLFFTTVSYLYYAYLIFLFNAIFKFSIDFHEYIPIFSSLFHPSNENFQQFPFAMIQLGSISTSYFLLTILLFVKILIINIKFDLLVFLPFILLFYLSHPFCNINSNQFFIFFQIQNHLLLLHFLHCLILNLHFRMKIKNLINQFFNFRFTLIILINFDSFQQQ